jgi:hypothetical protein
LVFIVFADPAIPDQQYDRIHQGKPDGSKRDQSHYFLRHNILLNPAKELHPRVLTGLPCKFRPVFREKTLDSCLLTLFAALKTQME